MKWKSEANQNEIIIVEKKKTGEMFAAKIVSQRLINFKRSQLDIFS